MPKLKNSVINKILNQLEGLEFCKEDFLVDFPDSDALVKITFRAMPKYNFIIDEAAAGGSLATIGAISSGKKLRKKFAL